MEVPCTDSWNLRGEAGHGSGTETGVGRVSSLRCDVGLGDMGPSPRREAGFRGSCGMVVRQSDSEVDERVPGAGGRKGTPGFFSMVGDYLYLGS